MINFSWKNIFSTVFRFPFEIISGIIFLVIGISSNHYEEYISKYILPEYIISSILLFFLLLLGSVVAENYQKKKSWQHFTWIGFSFILFAFSLWSFWKDSISGNYTDISFFIIQNLIWIISLILSVIVFGFNKKQEDEKNTWKAIKSIFFAILLSFFSGIILFIGTSLLYAACMFLFNIEIPETLYIDTLFFIIGTISSLTFLTFFPNPNIQNNDNDPSPFQKIFTLYIILPLSVAYTFILYSYSVKILLEQAFPNGFLAGFIAGFSAIIIINLFLFFPLNKTNWIQKVFRIGSILLIPQGILMIWTILLRINEYGITEPRYLGILFGIWIISIGIIWGIINKFSLRTPIVILIGLFSFSTFGVWSAENISLQSQANRLFSLKENPQKTNENIYQMQNIVEYLFNQHSLSSLEKIEKLQIKNTPNHCLQYKIPIAMYRCQNGLEVIEGEPTKFQENVSIENEPTYSYNFQTKKGNNIFVFSGNSEHNDFFQIEDGGIILTIHEEKFNVTEYILDRIKNPKNNKTLTIDTEKISFNLLISNFDGLVIDNKFLEINMIEGTLVLSK